MPTWALISGGAIAWLGLLLLIRAKRGPWEDDHPRCRNCGYDLYGSDTAHETCPECGRSLKDKAKAVRIGKRRRRPKTALLALLLLAAALMLGGLQGFLTHSGKSWLEYAPYSVLRMRAKSLDTNTRQRAIKEVTDRHYQRRLTDHQILSITEDYAKQLDAGVREWDPGTDDTFVLIAYDGGYMPPALWQRLERHFIDYVYDGPMRDADRRYTTISFQLGGGRMSDSGLLYAAEKVLAYQADHARPWHPELATPLVESQRRGILTADKWLLYLRQGMEHAYTLEVRRIVRVDDPVPYRLMRGNVRFHEQDQMPAQVSISTPAYEQGTLLVRMAGMEKHGGKSGILRSLPGSGGWWGSSVQFTPEQWQSVVPGKHTLHLEIEIAYLDVWEDSETTHDLIRFTLTYSASTQVVDENSNAIPGPVTSLPADAHIMQAAIGIDTLRRIDTGETWSYQGWLSFSQPLPVAIRAEIVATTSDGEFHLGTVSKNAGETIDSHFFGEFFQPPAPFVETVTIEIRPNKDIALRAYSVEPYWGETIVIEDVPIERLGR